MQNSKIRNYRIAEKKRTTNAKFKMKNAKLPVRGWRFNSEFKNSEFRIDLFADTWEVLGTD